jgi:hypothetical protein
MKVSAGDSARHLPPLIALPARVLPQAPKAMEARGSGENAPNFPGEKNLSISFADIGQPDCRAHSLLCARDSHAFQHIARISS